MMRGHKAALLLAATGIALAGCGGDDDNGVADLSADEILSKAQEAAEAADSLHVRGEVDDDDDLLVIDMELSVEGSSGTMTAEGMTVEVLNADGTYYMKADAETWNMMSGDPAAGQLVADRYVLIPPDQAGFGLDGFNSLSEFTDLMLTPGGDIAKGEETEIDGAKVIGLTSDEGGTLYVATTGDPLPMQLASPEGASGGFDLDWDVTVEIAAPDEDDVIDISSFF